MNAAELKESENDPQHDCRDCTRYNFCAVNRCLKDDNSKCYIEAWRYDARHELRY